jgi:hypothetical protein
MKFLSFFQLSLIKILSSTVQRRQYSKNIRITDVFVNACMCYGVALTRVDGQLKLVW